jgi:hypothetical protein
LVLETAIRTVELVVNLSTEAEGAGEVMAD